MRIKMIGERDGYVEASASVRRYSVSGKRPTPTLPVVYGMDGRMS